MNLINILKDNTNIKPEKHEKILALLLNEFVCSEIIAYEIDDHIKNHTLLKIATIDGNVKQLVYNEHDNSLSNEKVQVSINNQEHIFSLYSDLGEYIKIIQIFKEKDNDNITLTLYAISNDDLLSTIHTYKDDNLAAIKIVDAINIFNKLTNKKFNNRTNELKKALK